MAKTSKKAGGKQENTLPTKQVIEGFYAAGELGAVKGLLASLKMRLSLLGSNLKDVQEAFDEQQKALIQENAEKDEEGNFVESVDKEGKSVPGTYVIPPAAREKHAAAMKELLEVEVAVSFTPVPLEQYMEDLDERKIDIPHWTPGALAPFLAD